MSEEQSKLYNYTPHFNGKVIEIRHMGYDFIDALLELTDNSAAKKCLSKNIYVILHEGVDKRLSAVSVIDDGNGMDFKNLKESFIFNLLKVREEGDIGKFHVGMKYAAIVIGSDITILSRRNAKTVGLWADIETMSSLDSFNPTELCEDVSDEWALRHVDKNDYEKFISSDSGTLISIKRIETKCRGLLSKLTNELQKSLPNSYMNLYNDCILHLYNNNQNILTIAPNNLFYINEEEKLDTDHRDYYKPLVYETELTLYRDVEGNEKVIETNTNNRTTYNKDFVKKNITNGSSKKPVYYEIKTKRGANNRLTSEFISIPYDGLPDKGTKVGGVFKLRIIQVSEETYKSEKELFPEGSKLYGDRKGFFFLREIRIVGSAKQLGTKFNDRTIMAAERQRCLVEFTSDADNLVGSKYNKQMSEHALPSKALNDSLLAIWNQIKNNWNKLYPGKSKTEVNSDDEGSVEEVPVLLSEKSTTGVSNKQSIFNILTNSSNKLITQKLTETVKTQLTVAKEEEKKEIVEEKEEAVVEKEETLEEKKEAVVEKEETLEEKKEAVEEKQEAVEEAIVQEDIESDSDVSLSISEAESGTHSETNAQLNEIDILIKNIVPIDTNKVVDSPVVKPDEYVIEYNNSNLIVYNHTNSYIIENLNNSKQLFDWIQSEKKNVGLYNFIVQSLLTSLYNYQVIQNYS